MYQYHNDNFFGRFVNSVFELRAQKVAVLSIQIDETEEEDEEYYFVLGYN